MGPVPEDAVSVVINGVRIGSAVDWQAGGLRRQPQAAAWAAWGEFAESFPARWAVVLLGVQIDGGDGGLAALLVEGLEEARLDALDGVLCGCARDREQVAGPSGVCVRARGLDDLGRNSGIGEQLAQLAQAGKRTLRDEDRLEEVHVESLPGSARALGCRP